MGGTVQPVPPPLPACVRLTVCEAWPAAATVTMALRAAGPVLACTVTVTDPLPEPEAGLTPTQDWSAPAVQLVFDVTEKLPLLAAAPKLIMAGDTARVPPVPPLAPGDPA